MILDEEIRLEIKSSKIIHKLNELGINSKIGDIIYLKIDQLWKGSNLKINVKCDICGNTKKIMYIQYIKNSNKYNLYCCNNKCAYIKSKITNLERYGVENYSQTIDFKEKYKTINLEKYGADNVMKLELFKERLKQTFLDKYGVENYSQTAEYKEKVKKTNLERYGVENYFQTDECKNAFKKISLEQYGVEDLRSSDIIKNKRKQTNLDKYGVESYFQTDECKKKFIISSIEKYGVEDLRSSDIIKNKRKQTNLERYGFVSNSMSDECKEKLKKTNLERYGVEYPMQVEEFSLKQNKNSSKIQNYNEILYYQGSYEKDFLDYCKNNNILMDVSRGFSIKYNFNDHEKIHYPDFYIKKYNLIVEIKSSYYYNLYLEQNIAKYKKCIEMGFNYIFIINKDYTEFNIIVNI